MKYVLIMALALLILSCSKEQAAPPAQEEIQKAAAEPMVDETSAPVSTLESILAAQPEDTKARYMYRHPKETIELFGIQPGMIVAEVLPGGGWYSKILIPYIGETGKLVGLGYSQAMAEDIFPPKFQTVATTFTSTWPQKMADTGATGAEISAITFGAVPEEMNGTLDRIVFIRALHHIGRAEPKGGHFTSAIDESLKLLKPGGQVGIVQHESPESMTDEWAIGDKGYMKKSNVISAFEAAGFSLVVDSPINNNANDVPGEDDVVWRLPPSLRGADEDEALKAQMTAIGESNRMTLVFEKPAS